MERGIPAILRFRKLLPLLLLFFSQISDAQQTVRLQLKWYHQFQFAGYYAAIEKGYYKNAGLNVQLLEAQEGKDPINSVLQGQAEFGVGTSDLLLLRTRQKPVVVLAVIFQHSPLILLTRKDPSIQSLHDLQKRPVMIEPGSAELFAYLRREGVPVNLLDVHSHTFDTNELINGKIAAMSAYSTDEPFSLQKANIEYEIFSPRSAGIDFYGDNLFTTEEICRRNPKQVRSFVEASLAGWKYALDHPQEIVDLILSKYSQRKSREHLLFEAKEMRRLIFPDLVELGYMYTGRWQHIMETYKELGMIQKDIALDQFLYNRNPKQNSKWLYFMIAGALVFGLIVSGVLARFYKLNQALRREIHERQFLENELRRVANIDPLTAISNRRYFLERAQIEQQRCIRHHHPLSVLIMDVDHFKLINDRYGHTAGDEALRQFAMICARVLRNTDLFGRIGGDEFAACLPETSLKGAESTAERLRSETANLRLVSGQDKIQLTISIGAIQVGQEESFNDALQRVDSALYQAKTAGRNQVVILS
jgi:diguanylate cyclase (GGDEF)-like protein